MFDAYASELINMIPILPDLNHAECRRALSKVYFYIMRYHCGIPNDESSEQDMNSARFLLRRMADTLENIAVFDRLHGISLPHEIENACAFVAAESLSLLLLLEHATDPGTQEDCSDFLIMESNYIAIEAALLYMIGGYDINAISVVKNIEIPNEPLAVDSIHNILRSSSVYLIKHIKSFCCGDIRASSGYFPDALNNPPDSYELLLKELKIRFYKKIFYAIDAFMAWLRGSDNNGYDRAITQLDFVRNASTDSKNYEYTYFADMYHLSNLLLVAVNRTSNRSVVHKVPKPNGLDEKIKKDYPRFRTNELAKWQLMLSLFY